MTSSEKQAESNSREPVQKPVLVWFREDLRVADNPALSEATRSGSPVVGAYILDDSGRHTRPLGGGQRWWLHHSLAALREKLRSLDVELVLRRGDPGSELAALAAEVGPCAVHWSKRYDPAALRLDEGIAEVLHKQGIETHGFAARLLHEPDEVRTAKGEPYRVYSPFWRALEQLPEPRAPLPAASKAQRTARPFRSDRLEDWRLLPRQPDWSTGIAESWQPGEDGAAEALNDFITSDAFARYDTGRDWPDRNGTSRLSPHLAFGEISPHQIWQATSRRPQKVGATARTTFRKELGWREFSYHLLFHNPHLGSDNFDDRFDAFSWRKSRTDLVAWQRGRTGFPIVDAGMRQLWQTGWMHNRVRMICASFLTKDLLIDWREGEAWFWDTLVDADPASNAAQWQWVAGSGADAAPYFRIFNPILQGEKFDPEGDYVRRYVPELADLDAEYIHKPWEAPDAALKEAGVRLGDTYPDPIVDHHEARRKALAAYTRIKDAA